MLCFRFFRRVEIHSFQRDVSELSWIEWVCTSGILLLIIVQLFVLKIVRLEFGSSRLKGYDESLMPVSRMFRATLCDWDSTLEHSKSMSEELFQLVPWPLKDRQVFPFPVCQWFTQLFKILTYKLWTIIRYFKLKYSESCKGLTVTFLTFSDFLPHAGNVFIKIVLASTISEILPLFLT